MLNIYRASAGSGKTFALTLEYFRTIFESPLEYKNILAVTFTNKATEEMKSRIINELHNLAQGNKSSYGEILQQELKLTDDQLKNKAVLLRTILLHDYGRLAVTTIDKFFQRILKSFTRELGIFPGYNVELDSNFILIKAVDKMMQQIENNPALKSWVRELINDNIDEGKSWNVKSRIIELGEELFKENYMLFDKHILDKFNDKDLLKNYKQFLNTTINNYKKQMQDIAASALALMKEQGLVLSDFKGNKSGCASFFFKLADENYNAPTATIQKGIDNLDAWFTKDSVNKGKIESIYPQLNSLLKKGTELYNNDYRKYLSAIQLSGNLYQLGILNDLYQEVRAYCNEKGLMLLSDTTYVLNSLINGNDSSFLFEKYGNYYNHLMIDEFQDTSAMQWKNFRPLVVNSLSEGYRAMIVGDVKQSIYRWRNGEWSLLAYEIEKQFRNFGVNNIVLNDNWRSCKEIVEFNNIFFETAVRQLVALFDADAGGENLWSKEIEEAYCGLEQQPRKSSSGYVEISFGPEKKEENADIQIMKDIMPVIHDIQARGGSLKDIVILVRGAKEGAFIANFLMDYNKTTQQPINFISNDSLYIGSSPNVQFIVSILKYITQPYDMVNKATILYLYQEFVREVVSGSIHDVFNIVHNELLQEINGRFLNNSENILSYSLYETIENIISKFALKEKQENIPYLIAFQDVIYEYESNNSNSITLFLEWWEKEKDKRVLSTSENTDAVRILTIHKSKGLEFRHVILPFCNWPLDSVRPVRRIWCENKEDEFNRLEYAPLNYSSKMMDTFFSEDYYNEHLKTYIDNLNLLYVAFTRAKNELYIFPYSPHPHKDGKISVSDVGALIYQIVGEIREMPQNEMSINDGMSLSYGTKSVLHEENLSENIFSLPDYPVWNPESRISVKYRFRDYEPQDTALSAIDEGKLLHEIFKSIKHIDDVETAVWQSSLVGLIKKDEKDEYCNKINDYISNPEVASWFAPDCEVINEKDILFPGGDKVRPDRVIVRNDTLLVIDYKFGLSEESKYLKQVRYYCNTMRKMGYKKVEGYIWYVKTGKIVPVDNTY